MPKKGMFDLSPVKDLRNTRKIDKDGPFVEKSVDTEHYGESSRLLDEFSSFAVTPK